jgi:hypothetical protein
VDDGEQMRARLLEARRKMMAGVPLTAPEVRALQVLSDEAPSSPLERAVGALLSILLIVGGTSLDVGWGDDLLVIGLAAGIGAVSLARRRRRGVHTGRSA